MLACVGRTSNSVINSLNFYATDTDKKSFLDRFSIKIVDSNVSCIIKDLYAPFGTMTRQYDIFIYELFSCCQEISAVNDETSAQMVAFF